MAGIPPHAGRGQRGARVTPRRLAALGVVLVAVAALAVGGWLLTRDSSKSTTTATRSVTPLGPVASTPATLLTFAKALGRPIYWAGPQPGATYEFTETRVGNVYVRYLAQGVQVGDRRPAFPVVGTYPSVGALAALEAVAGGKRTNLKGGGIVVSTAADPKSVHIAYPGIDYQIEVYDPVAGQALAIALSGRVRPVH